MFEACDLLLPERHEVVGVLEFIKDVIAGGFDPVFLFVQVDQAFFHVLDVLKRALDLLFVDRDGLLER